jgi:hypothetical protein
MTHLLNENATTLILLLAFFICEVLAHTTKIRANSLFQLIFGWIKKEKDKLPKVQHDTPEARIPASERDGT